MFTAWTGKKFVGAWTDQDTALRYAASRNLVLVEVDLSQAIDTTAMADTIARERAENIERNKDKPRVSLKAVSVESSSRGRTRQLTT